QGRPPSANSPVPVPPGEDRQPPLTGLLDPQEVKKTTASPERQSDDPSRTSLGRPTGPHSGGVSEARAPSKPAADVGAQPVVGPDLDESLLEGHAGPSSPEDENTAHKGEDTWKAFSGEAPAGFHQPPLWGEQWQVAWALKQVGVLPRGTPKV